jgi:predicted membrane-bound spermidine synthase
MVAQSPAVRLFVVGLVVFLANAGLLVLQLAGGRLLSPFVGSSLETWTMLIGAFLTGIALGNDVGGRYSVKLATPKGLALILVAGALSALWMIGVPEILEATNWHRPLGLTARIVVLSAVLCLPAGFTLSLLTPAAIRLGLPDVRRAGSVAGVIFSLGSLGCLVGNYVTGFVLIPAFTINTIVLVTAVLLILTAALAYFCLQMPSEAPKVVVPQDDKTPTAMPLSMIAACAIVFACSFAGMTLELTASRLLAQVLGVSIYTWTGIIGVMLAGTASGNWFGGAIADNTTRGRERLGLSLMGACTATALILILYIVVIRTPLLYTWVDSVPLIPRVMLWTFVLFYLPMFALGTISPQVIRLTVRDLETAGATAGRVYAWSTLGAIVGTFVTGYFLISHFGMFRTILLMSLVPGFVMPLVVAVHKRSLLLYGLSIISGGAVTGMVKFHDFFPGITAETNYYTIQVLTDEIDPQFRALQLDLLTHSRVDMTNPRYIYYKHEWTQIDFVLAAAANHPTEQRVLVIGGGGYTFPRCASSYVPTAKFDVVEIDPGVSKVAYSHLGLDPKLPITTFNQDGRQYVEEVAPKGVYHVVTLDAVNDLSVPGHLLTKEFNDGVKKVLTPDGVYLVTVIDMLEDGLLWKAVVHTLRETYKHVEILTPQDEFDPRWRQVYCIYASDTPLDLDKLDEQLHAQKIDARMTYRLPDGEMDRMLKTYRLILRDQFAPVDNMMSGVFRAR